jgi:diguanylate cyclase (GGDEF)-like protein
MDEHQNLTLLKEIINSIPELVMAVSEGGKYLELGGVSEHDPLQVVGKYLSDLFPAETAELFERTLATAFAEEGKKVTVIEYTLTPSPDLKIPLLDNIPRTFELKVTPLNSRIDGERVAICICRDITELRNNEKSLIELSELDPLTGVYNRRKLYERLEVSFQEYLRYATQASFLLFDLNDFKHINDKYGHLVGDQVICHFAQLCSTQHRVVDTFARLGGDEFGLIMPNVNQDEAACFAKRSRELLKMEVQISDELSIKMSVSFGISTFNPEDTSIDAIIGRADRNMYRAKFQTKSTNT